MPRNRMSAKAAEMLAVENVSDARRSRMAIAAAKLGARKKIQAKQTKFAVTKMRRTRATGFSDGLALFRNTWNARCNARATPCSNPQIAKFQLAPCHKPPSSIVITRFEYVKIFHLERRPGSEK